MLFTIAIPTYNNEKTIKKAIRSALEQSYKDDYEILVINNASQDKTLEKINELKNDKIKIINNSDTVSLFENHNVALKNAIGDYVVFCHSDDELFPQALKILEKKIKERDFPKKYIIWGRSFFRDFFVTWKKSGLQLNTVLSGIEGLKIFLNGGLTPSGTCYSRKSFIELGGFGKMHSKVTASDMTCMQIAIISGFEIEMMDRIIFKRTLATTANKECLKNNFNEYEAMKEMKNTHPENYYKILNYYINIFSSQNYSRTLNLICIEEKKYINIKKIIKLFLRNPWYLLKNDFRRLIKKGVINVIKGRIK